MRKKKFNIFNRVGDKAEIKIAAGVKEIHPVMESLAESLANLDFIHFIRISTEDLKTSSEITAGRVKIPVTKPDHLTATGIPTVASKEPYHFLISPPSLMSRTDGLIPCTAQVANSLLWNYKEAIRK